MTFFFSTEDKFNELPDRIREYLPTFFENRWGDLLLFEKSLLEEDYQGMRDYCHKQIGVAVCYNCFKLHEVIKYLQVQARDQNFTELKATYPILRNYLSSCRAESK